MEVRTHREAVPWYERLSMLGGMMGLLLGFSAVTGFEILLFLFDYLHSATPMYKSKSRKQLANRESKSML